LVDRGGLMWGSQVDLMSANRDDQTLANRDDQTLDSQAERTLGNPVDPMPGVLERRARIFLRTVPVASRTANSGRTPGRNVATTSAIIGKTTTATSMTGSTEIGGTTA
jgi:hypothetical protein